MQRYISFLSLLLLVLTGFVSCESDILEGEWSKTPPIDYYFSVDRQQLDLGPASTREMLSVQTNGSWSASSDVSWITLYPSSGSADSQVTISVEENNTSSDRVGEITVKSQQLNKTTTVRVSQLANNFDFAVDIDSIGSSSASFSDLITLTTNDEWSISADKDWVSFSVSSGKGDATININVIENKTPDDRFAYINIKGKYSGKSVAVKVLQSGKYLTVNTNSLSFSTASESKTIVVSSDGAYSVSQEGEWFSIVQDADTLTVTSEKMIATEPRSGKIIIALNNLTSGALSQTIEVKQSGMNYDFSVESSPITSSSAANSSLFKITTNDDWTISSSESWIVVSSSSGSGNADITVNLSENKTTSSRTGSVTITGKNGGGSVTINVSQEGKYLTVSPETIAFGSAADSQKVTISTDGTFTTNKSDSWISITADGNTLTISATQNTTAEERSGSVTVSLSNLTSGSLSQTITVTQSALSHSLSVNKETISVGSVSTTEKFEIASNDSWEILSNVEWATLSLTTGSGNGIVSLTIGANTKTSSREGTITIKGANSGTKTIKVTQEGETYTLNVDKTSLSVKSASANDIIEITSNDTWTASSDVTWAKLSLDSGSGNKSLTVSISENTAPTSREGTITIKGANSGTKTIKISQEGVGYSLSVDKTTLSVGSSGSTNETISITTNDSWEASSDVTWASLSVKSGSGDKTLTVTIGANVEETSREGTITIKSANSSTKTIKISQEGESYTLSVDKTTLSVGSASASDIIEITSNDSWTVSSNVTWINVSMDSGSGNKSLSVIINANTDLSSREGLVTIKGLHGDTKEIIILQDALSPLCKVAEIQELSPIAFTFAPGLYNSGISENYMESLYGSVVDGGMTADWFHTVFPELLSKDYYSINDFDWKKAYAGKTSDGSVVPEVWQGDLFLGDVDESVVNSVLKGDLSAYVVAGFVTSINDPGLFRGYAVEISVAADIINPIYEQDFTKSAFFVFKSSDNLSNIIIPVKLNIKAGTFSYAYAYNEAFWSVENGERVMRVTSTLYSDMNMGKTAELTCDLSIGYMYSPSINSLVNYTAFGGETTSVTSDIVFDETRFNELLIKASDLSLSRDKKTLYYRNVAAVEIKENQIYLVDNASGTGSTGDIDAVPTFASLAFVGRSIPLSIIVNTGGKTLTFDKFSVYFNAPLELASSNMGIVFKDIIDEGRVIPISATDHIILKESFGNRTQINFSGKNTDVKLVSWYAVQCPYIDIANALINIDTNGQIGTSYSKLSNIVNSSGEQLFAITVVRNIGTTAQPEWVEDYSLDGVRYLQYQNNSGHPINQNLEILIPIVFETKWQKFETNIRVTIQPNL